MPQPLYKDAACKKPVANFHKGLWFERFFTYSNLPGKVEESDKKSAIEDVRGEAGNNGQLNRFAERQIKLVNNLDGQFQIFSLDWHFVTGMGNEHPVENGFLWHPVLGTPYLQGSSIKGLLRSWLEQNEVSREILHQWFGSAAKKPEPRDKENQAGGFIFHDAIPVKSPTVAADIMTPHMGKWYEKGGQNNPANQPETVPADWHNPVPVPFLVTKDAAFLFAVSPRTQEMAGQMDLVMEELGNALEWLGAGAKTSVGYGSMTRGKEEKQLE
nr:type III-B CRISPR module RAMP protein Cmr6 [Endozoicomonas sp.]